MQVRVQRYEYYAYSSVGRRGDDGEPNRRALAMSLLSRRDERTQPGVLTPGNPKKKVPPRRGGRRCLTNGLSINETANRYLPPLQGGWSSDRHPGLKPRAESFRPFGTIIETGRRNSSSPTLEHAARRNSRTITITRRQTPNAL